MPRPNRLWFHKQSQSWVTEVGGRRFKLAKGRDQKKSAEAKFHELMVECSLNPPGGFRPPVRDGCVPRGRIPRLGVQAERAEDAL